jgi:hypothetical protein
MLRQFCENVSEDSKRALFDSAHPFPFANLERKIRKAHGIGGAREPRTKANLSGRSSSKEKPSVPSSATQDDEPYATLGVTANDLRDGRIRIPSRSTSLARTLLPSQKATIDVKLKGHLLPASWDPKTGGDKQRSGVLRVSRALQDFVREDEVLMVSIDGDGVICIN